MRIIIILALAIAGGAIAAGLPHAVAAGGQRAARTVQIAAFSRIEVRDGVEVRFTPGAPAARLEGPESQFKDILITVDGAVLRIGRPPGVRLGWWRSDAVVVHVTGPAKLDALTVSAGAHLRASGLTAGALALQATSGGEAHIAGACESLTARAVSGGELAARGLVCDRGVVEAASGGEAEVFLRSSVTARAASGGDVTVHGAPAAVDTDERSGGGVTILR